ncbi:MAG: hypothetical protein M3065_11260 [Actinomycetota bacterium]|nr:hypothetical protein [Actinomycetota bacterium]
MVLDQVVLVLAACALGSAALGVAGRVAAGGDALVIDRVLVAAPVAAGFVVCWTLALGLAGLAGSVLALAAGPILAWAAIRSVLPGSSRSLAAELTDRWNRVSRGQRALALALAGVAAASVLEVAQQPGFNVDPISYHLADVIGWLHSGHAGAAQTFSYDFPVGYYPVTNEVLLTWVLGISRSFAPLALWSTAAAAFALLALWRFLRLLGVPQAGAGAGVAAFGTLPIFVIGLNYDGPSTDLPAMAWLACAAALSAGARGRPALLGPALLAAGLGVGTKTTVAPLAVVVLLAGAWSARAALGASRWWLAGGGAGGLIVAAPWYVRDTLTHGWPLWPFSSGPTGDPLPHAMSLFHVSFISRPVATVRAISSQYVSSLAGGLGLMLGALAIPLLVRSKAALLAAAVAVAALLAWAVAPFTGLSRLAALEVLAPTTTRYLLSALGACAVAVAVAARDAPPLGRRVIIGLLLAASAGSLVSDAVTGFPSSPNLLYLLGGAAIGALAGWGAPALRLPAAPAFLRAAALMAVAVFLAASAPGWLWRESEHAGYAHALLGFMMGEPGFISGSQPISFAPSVIASLAGPRLRHPIELIPARESCAVVQARLRRGWVVVFPGAIAPGITTAFDAPYCLGKDRPIYAYEGAVVYGPA